MLYGIQSSQDLKQSNIGRALGEAIPPIRAGKRLPRNLKPAELEAALFTKLVEMASARIGQDTVLALDLSDIRKEYSRKMGHLATVWDGSTPQTPSGYWRQDVTGAEVSCREIVPVRQKLFSAQAEQLRSQNAEIPAMVDQVNRRLAGRGIWMMDRGCDRKKLPVISQRLFAIPPFRFSALADGIRRLLSGSAFQPPPESPPDPQLELALVWPG